MLGGNEMNFFLIADAAPTDGAGAAANGGGMGIFTIIWLVAIIAFFYFFMLDTVFII